MNKKKALAILAVILLTVMIIGAVVIGKKRDAETSNEKNIYVSTDLVVEKDLETMISTKGTVQAKEQAAVYSELNSSVKEILVAEGDYVKEGDVLVILEDDTLEKQIRDAEIGLEISKINYANAVTSTGDDSQITRAKNALDNSQKDYENTKALYEAGAVSLRELEQMEYAYNEAVQTYNTTIKSASTSSNTLKVSALDVEGAENRLNDLIESRDHIQILATITGQVTSVSVEVGDMVSTTMPVAMIETTDNLEVLTYIGEYDINLVNIGQSVKISGYGVGDQIYDGKVTFIGASAEVQSVGQSTERSVLVKLDILGESTFRPNFTADVEIEVASVAGAKSVPYEAVDYRDGENFIFKVVDGKAVMVPVELGVQGEILIEVISDGLMVGDEIVLDPPSTLIEGNNIVVLEGASR